MLFVLKVPDYRFEKEIEWENSEDNARIILFSGTSSATASMWQMEGSKLTDPVASNVSNQSQNPETDVVP